MLPYYDIKSAKRAYGERLQAAEAERRWLAVRRQQLGVAQQFAAAIQRWVGAGGEASVPGQAAAARHA